MLKENYNRLVFAGLVATSVMTVMAYLSPLLGMPKMDFAAMLGSLITDTPPQPFGSAWWFGMIWHFIDGTFIFPLIFQYLFYILPGRPWQKGLCFGLGLWFLSLTLAMPFFGYGFFASQSPQQFLVILGSLMGHSVYGTILGAIAGRHRLFGYVSGKEDDRPLGKNRLAKYEQETKT
jgi:hypothetical protein